MSRRRVLAAVAIVLTAVALAGCSNPFAGPSLADAKAAESKSAAVTKPTILNDGKLVVGVRTNSVSAPYCATTSNSVLAGIDVDVASAIADQMGLSVEFVTSANAKDELGSKCDIVMDVTGATSSGYTVVGSYVERATAFFSKQSSTYAATDLNGKTVGVQTGSASEAALSRSSLVVTQRGFGNINEAFEALNSGTVDCVLCDAYSGAYLATQYSGINMCGTLDAPVSYGVGVASSNSALQDAVKSALEQVSKGGLLDVIRQRWVGTMPSLTTENQIKGVATTSSTSTGDAAESAESTQATSGVTAGSNAATV